jgi:hypothetical protein
MAKQGTKTEMLKCVVGEALVTFQHVRRDGEEWKVVSELAIDCDAVPNRLEDGEGYASMKAYGIRAFLSDRTSQFREFGIAGTLAEMSNVYEALKNGVYRTKRKSGGTKSDLDLLAQAVASVKGLTFEVAKASVKALDKERQDRLRKAPAIAEALAALAKATAAADTVELDDLFGEEE